MVKATTAGSEVDFYSWLTITGNPRSVDDTALRAFATVFRHLTASTSVLLTITHADHMLLEAVQGRLEMNEGVARRVFAQITLWTEWEIEKIDSQGASITMHREQDNGR
jgi:hypothetical protein